MTEVAIIGPGRVGTLLATALSRAGHRVVAVGGGTAAARDHLAGLVAGVRPEASAAAAARRAHLVAIAVPDDAIEGVARGLARDGAVGTGQQVIHLAGSRGLGVLSAPARAGARTAVCHPAMTVPTGASDPQLLVGAAWAVTAVADDRQWTHALVRDLGGDPHDLRDDVRGLYHAGLAVASNAVGATVAVARRLLLAAGIQDPSVFLGPLVAASTANVLAEGAAALTGPVVRGDLGTVASHLNALERDVPELAAAYRSLSRLLLAQIAPSLPPDTAAALDALLAGDGDRGDATVDRPSDAEVVAGRPPGVDDATDGDATVDRPSDAEVIAGRPPGVHDATDHDDRQEPT